MNVMTMVRLNGVTKRFGRHVAVDDFSLTIPEGCIYGLLGPNGSGKTTTIRMIMGILHPDEGSVDLFGTSPDDARRRQTGYLPEERGLYKKMKVVEVLTFLAELKGLDRTEGRRRAMNWLERLDLSDWALAKVEDLSKGMQQKVQFIGTVLHEPRFLILDEPFSGLDPINQDVLEDIVHEFKARGTTILFSTHLMNQAERLCERVCLIARAKKVLDGELRELRRAERLGVIAVRSEGPDEWLRGPEIRRSAVVGDAVHLTLVPEADPQELLRKGIEAGATIHRFELVEPSLHEIFVRHAGAADPSEELERAS